MFIKKISRNQIISIIFISILIISTLTAVIYFNNDEERHIEEEKPDVFVVDDRISPLVNQGLVLEVLRIRHRDLHKKLTSFGNSWQKEPTFYFISNIDGLEYKSKDVSQHGRSETIYFNTWDSMFQENKIVKDAEKEQECSTITLQIVEVNKKGVLGFRTKEKMRDEFTVNYDYRTGRWSGDDSFMDKDGCGYYLGKTFEVWFNIYQMDYDDDFIPYWTEVNVLGTDPTVDDSKEDPDNDGIPTSWEWKWGYDPFTWNDHKNLDPDIDGIENIEEYKMSKWFANPYIQDVYVEVDFMERGGLRDPPHIFYKECQQAIIEKYAEHNIKLFFDDGWPDTTSNGGGEFVKHYKKLSQESGMILQYYNRHFSEERRGIFRYILTSHGGGFNHPSKGNVYDSIVIADFVKEKAFDSIKNFVKLGVRPTKRGQYIALAAIAMHELGHSIGLSAVDFEGIDNVSYLLWFFPKKSYVWKDYESVLNYLHAYNPKLLDYSDGHNGPPYDQNDWGNIFVANFQYNSNYLEESGGTDITNIYSEEIFIKGYSYNENLTDKFMEIIDGYSPVKPINVEWKVFQIDEKQENSELRDIKIYVKPKVPAGKWVLYSEGNLNSNKEMEFYSQLKLVNEIKNLIKK